MWCRHCKQDVPVLRPSAGAPACPRCRRALAPADEGVDLASFDSSAPRPATITPWVLEADRFELQRIGRRLRPCVRHEAACQGEPAVPLIDAPLASEPPHYETELAVIDAARAIETSESANDDATGAEAAADCGLLVTLAGIVTMAIQGEGFIAEEFWRWGFIGAVVGGATFAVGVLRLATGAWRHSRELRRELEALRGEFAKRRAATGAHDAHPAFDMHPMRGGQSPFAPRTAQKGAVPAPRFEEPGAKLRAA
jgi:hypothetical protein